jgi:UDP-N-acetylenolpyruvoylglucosamine reductase
MLDRGRGDGELMRLSLRFADWPLRAKMAGLLVMASLLPLLIGAYVELRQERARVFDGMKSLLSARGDQIARELDAFHRSYLRAVEQIARLPGVAAYCDAGADARQIFDWVCAIRGAKLPDPARIGNVGSFFKNPRVSAEQCRDIIGRDPEIVHYPLADGTVKLAAGWMIDACGWKGKTIGGAAVYERHSLVLVNRSGQATGGEVVTLARAIQESVYGRFGIRLEPEPVVV